MKIVIEDSQDEEEVIIRCREMSEDLLHIISLLRAVKNTVIGYEGDNIHRFRPSEVYYFEAVDNKVFLYCKKSVTESRQKLYEIEETLCGAGFLRVSKSVVLNLSHIQYLSPAFSGRFEATLDNGEKVIISRQYVSELKKLLGC